MNKEFTEESLVGSSQEFEQVKGHQVASLKGATEQQAECLLDGRELKISKKIFIKKREYEGGKEQNVVSLDLEFDDKDGEKRRIAVSRGEDSGIIDIKADFPVWHKGLTPHICAVDPENHLFFVNKLDQIGEPGSSLVRAFFASLEGGPYRFKYIDLYMDINKIRIMPAEEKGIRLESILKVIENQFFGVTEKTESGNKEKDIFNELIDITNSTLKASLSKSRKPLKSLFTQN